MSRRLPILLTAALIGASGWLAWQWQARQAPTPTVTAAALIPTIPTRWEPLFSPVLQKNDTIALARSMDATFLPAWLPGWTARISNDTAFLLSRESAFLAYNEVVEALRLQSLHLPVLEPTLIQILQDPTVHEVLRDYSAQHLALLAEAQPTSAPRILTVFCEILEAPGTRHQAWCGTLLNASQQLLARTPQASAASFLPRLADITHTFSTARDVALPLRISLIQAFARNASPLALPVLRRLAADPTESDAILMATVGSLGQQGTPADLPLLKAIQARGDMASPAAATALKKILARHP
jgi:hypothetical protein